MLGTGAGLPDGSGSGDAPGTRAAMTASTSLRVIRPPSPVPVTVDGSMLVLVEQLAHDRREDLPSPDRTGDRGRPGLGGGRR